MSRQKLTLAGLGLLTLGALAFLGWAALRPVTSSVAEVTPPPAASTQPSTLPAAAMTDNVIATDLFTMTLPEGWQWTTQPWGDWQSDRDPQIAPLALAWPIGSSFEESATRFSIAAMPRYALSLEQYMLDVAGALSDTTGVAAVNARLVTDLRSDGLPTALIRYVTKSPAGEMIGYQAATFDDTGAKLLIATLVHQPDLPDGERLFRTLVSSLHLPTSDATGE